MEVNSRNTTGTKNKRNKKFAVDVCTCMGRYVSVYIYSFNFISI